MRGVEEGLAAAGARAAVTFIRVAGPVQHGDFMQCTVSRLFSGLSAGLMERVLNAFIWDRCSCGLPGCPRRGPKETGL